MENVSRFVFLFFYLKKTKISVFFFLEHSYAASTKIDNLIQEVADKNQVTKKLVRKNEIVKNKN